ncbi:acyltransferase [Truepera radiovictrix]|uniref:Transferase hexapeptide repeat containing protein n=1 Tax=Truepera radiovictrix (strain DSM 17093 / CIP 108686 / LMG 22925 / RQ-24) TaxID=649638 RepID=D7CXN6_TRURR|nr:acyltransferase [Truepera radiovictrix]ADI14638.1 transferase hexapeptide repeat containing protein [Truepera radiovictrix DSM 17093]WMT56812.1 acyltransferase [Truepera radiovictrix]
MPWLVPRALPPEGERVLSRFLGELTEKLDDPALDRNEVVRDTLAEVLYAAPFTELAERAPLAAFALDPRNVTFEAERYVVTDPERFARVKPLLWLWKSLDLTPFGQSVESGLRLRALLAARVFAHAGKNLKIFQNVEVSVGYNLWVGDDVTIHRGVFIDDIGGVTLHDGVSLSDFVNVYSHTHSVLESPDVTLKETVIGKGVRVAYHATVLAGTVLSDDSMVGAMALATRDLEPHVIGLGIPAKARVWKERAGDPRFASLVVDARTYARKAPVRANPDFRTEEPADPVEEPSV